MIRYQITDGTAHLDEGLWLAGLSRDADLIQIREGGLNTRGLIRLVRLVLNLETRSAILVNDRIDVAIAGGAAGVHLRSASLLPEVVRRITPPGFIISVACHNAQDLRSTAGADYALLSPVFQPLSKQDTRQPLGLPALTEMAGVSPVPIIALGGITSRNMDQCLRAGAIGVAGITMFRPL